MARADITQPPVPKADTTKKVQLIDNKERERMLIAQYAAVLMTLARALVLVHSQTDVTELPTTQNPTISPTTAMEPVTTTIISTTTATRNNIITISPTNSTEPTEFGGTTTATDQLTTSSNATSDSYVAMTELEGTLGHNNASSSSSISNRFVLSTTWKIVIIAGEFTVLTALPLVIIMILIVALGCMCKKYKRLKNRLIMPTEIVASNNYSREMTTAMESGVMLSNIKFLDDDIDTGDNVAYGQMTRVVEGRDNMPDNIMTTQNTDTDRQSGASSIDNVMTVEDNGADNTDHDGMSTEVKDHDDGTAAEEDDTAESNGQSECGSYVINDLYESIQMVER